MTLLANALARNPLTPAQLKEKYNDKDKEESSNELNETAIIAGRLMTKRGSERLALLTSKTVKAKSYVRKDVVGEENYEIFSKRRT